MTQEPLRFVQLTGCGDTLFGLDAGGQVWVYANDQPPTCWAPVPMRRWSPTSGGLNALSAAPPPASTGLTTVARTPDVR